MIGGRRPIRGRKPADRRVRVARPHSAYFRYTGPNQLVAKPAASAPRSGLERRLTGWKAWLIGRPLASEEEIGERLSKRLALPIFSSDAISSSAYATEEILRVLVVGGAMAFLFSIQVAAAIAILLAVVAISYRQVCRAFPNGGGAYAVARQELTPLLGLVAAAALLIDYVMTVAVSTSSAVEQLISISSEVNEWRIEVALLSITLITVANLRGLRESGNIFAVPTYLFVTLALVIVANGVFRIVTGQATGSPPHAEALDLGTQSIGILLLLKAFASGSVALTGTEAIANGVPAFKPPEAKNAANTLVAMAVLLAILFVGITVVADAYRIVPSEVGSGGPTVIALVAQTAFGDATPLYYVFQVSTALILFLAANTSYNAFPRLAALLAEDGFVPRQFAFRGDRLAFSTGILLLGLVAGFVVILGGGSTHALIPLYAVGVFIDFTIAQTGMVRHWLATKEQGWRYRLAINATGAVLTGVIALVVTSVKFTSGAWFVIVLIPTLVGLMSFIRRQYDGQAKELLVRDDLVFQRPHREQRVIIPVNGINRSVVQAVMFGRTLTSDPTLIQAVYVTTDLDEAELLRARWERQLPGVPLVVVESPYRALVGPVITYLDVLDLAWPPDKEAPTTIVVLPEYVAKHWWDRLLYNQTAKRLKGALVGREHTVIADVPYRRSEPHDVVDPADQVIQEP